jgi:hypothetical protein|tara:strand:+ start:724 stop:1281 length:558 start_codon:yes stop_codon:yes gene_type:complete
MKLLLENWKRFLTEQQGEYIGTIDDVGSDLYRISKRYGDKGDNLERFRAGTKVIRSRNTSADDQQPYLNSDGDPEHRIYFFGSGDDAKAAMMSDMEEVEAIVGDFSAEDRERGINDNLLLVRIPMNQLPQEVEFFTDPELEGTPYDTIYGAYPDGRAWTLAPKATDIQVASELLSYEEDDYYEDY